MKIIVGLGNPEGEYKGTRHNVGFEVINKLAYDYDINMKKYKHRSFIGDGFIKQKKVILAKPQTYMNLSGESIREILNFYKLSPEDIIVLYDDITLDVGEVKIRKKGSSGGHNGIKNILLNLNTDEFIRIKIGIGERPKNTILSDYVLTKFKESEWEKILEGMTKAGNAVECILEESLDKAMNKYNKKEKDVK